MSESGLNSRDTVALERSMTTLLSPLRYPDLDGWRRAVTRELKPLLGADISTFQLPWPERELLYSEEFDPAYVRLYTEDHIPELNRRKGYVDRIIELGVGNLELFWGHDLPWLYGSAYYNECLVPMRAFDPIWAAVPSPGSKFPAILLAHHERPGGRRFGERELRILRLLRPALAAAVSAVHHLDAHWATLTRTIDSLPTPALLFDGNGGLVHRNRAASRILELNPAAGLLLEAEAQRMACSRSGEARGLVHQAVRTRMGDFRLSVTKGVEGWGERPSTLVLLEAERSRLPGVTEVRERYRLTRRQAQVALLLADRKTNAEIAAVLGISEATARHHTEAAMLALGVHSRREVAGVLTAGDSRS